MAVPATHTLEEKARVITRIPMRITGEKTPTFPAMASAESGTLRKARACIAAAIANRAAAPRALPPATVTVHLTPTYRTPMTSQTWW
jgi:hypothetical protein